ncbi:MAG: 2,3-bisphosphoglycerate-independent phosphoglycerate mutase [Gammaproteobacteria bacterium]|nr:2,3-bisphosphoglycerate-independent phosphoglycerate mutase [Gammaproteobacteria bacterium]
MSSKPVILIILDGWGHSESNEFNAINSASKPTFDRLWRDYPHTLISASGIDVGLPGNQMGNSEVGHMNIGSGRVIDQDFTRITRAIEDGSFADNEILISSIKSAVDKDKAVHILGLLSPGGVHSHQEHIFALLKLAKTSGAKKVYLHAFLDGRDTAPMSAREYLLKTEEEMKKLGDCSIASIVGRFYAMDRNKNWDRTEIAYHLLTEGRAEFEAESGLAGLDLAYARGESDEFVKPTSIKDQNGRNICIDEGDTIIFANYRADRARQLSLAFTKSDFSGFERKRTLESSTFVSLTEYKADFEFPVAFPPLQHKNVFGEYIAGLGLRQLRIAETEKYAHVTFFFNGGEEKVFENEDRSLVPSPHVKTYDEQPEMNALEVARQMVDAINRRSYDAIISNFANADMVGHTGNFEAAVSAIETLDHCIKKVVEAALENGTELLITADHGNAEQMREYTTDGSEAQAHTAHTNNLVPLIYIGRAAEVDHNSAALCDLAPTMLYLMGLPQPEEMTGRTIFRLYEESKY